MARSLEQQQKEFAARRTLAMPLAGSIAWLAVGICGFVVPEDDFVLGICLFFATGSIFYLALILQRFTGEDILGRNREKNAFDRLFLFAILQALAGYAIAIPFFMVEPSSLPLSVGVLTGVMWIQYSALSGHWVGHAHFSLRTTLVVGLWYAWPEQRFTAIPLCIVAVYLLTMGVILRSNRQDS